MRRLLIVPVVVTLFVIAMLVGKSLNRYNGKWIVEGKTKTNSYGTMAEAHLSASNGDIIKVPPGLYSNSVMEIKTTNRLYGPYTFNTSGGTFKECYFTQEPDEFFKPLEQKSWHGSEVELARVFLDTFSNPTTGRVTNLTLFPDDSDWQLVVSGTKGTARYWSNKKP